ncbi:pantoate--beta-alanine ligase [Thiomicrorhabdus lithotrophica]|uniref:Pantothenate synthetase n=1 Tax=Thiomicrorhabdus lithotrophica TaxID=2949997 RepID=A0ABY8CBK2_9GAMM|nr:pantoate--beta-alanine ligase [Thiomicrorhabdus lithotrophica]WEJ63319.1 pantoate--beta-alanine ligase [Thiomicrorhabdus lithotrophica]
MQVFEQVNDLRKQVASWKKTGHTVGFVPTMGNLHQGHLNLVKIAQQTCDKVVVSVFVNPMQFGPNEDFDSYPRTFTEDQAKLASLQTDAVFYPTVEAIYPNGINQTKVIVPGALTGVLEGANRPGHFDGVATVVAKLFNMVQPDKAVFGQKDFQQLSVIRTMVEELALPIEIISAPIGRDVDGLALSSRNQYLNTEQRNIAPKLFTKLQDVAKAIQSGNQDFLALAQVAKQNLIMEGFDAVDYIEICNPITLLPAEMNDKDVVILAVARLGKTRLLDNILLLS